MPSVYRTPRLNCWTLRDSNDCSRQLQHVLIMPESDCVCRCLTPKCPRRELLRTTVSTRSRPTPVDRSCAKLAFARAETDAQRCNCAPRLPLQALGSKLRWYVIVPVRPHPDARSLVGWCGSAGWHPATSITDLASNSLMHQNPLHLTGRRTILTQIFLFSRKAAGFLWKKRSILER